MNGEINRGMMMLRANVSNIDVEGKSHHPRITLFLCMVERFMNGNQQKTLGKTFFYILLLYKVNSGNYVF